MGNRRQKNWMLAVGIAVIYTAAQTTQLVPRVPGVPWLELFLFELPVWCSLVAVAPAIFFVARRLPVLGSDSLRNAFLHLLPAVVILFAMFVLVEATRELVITPFVRTLGLAVTKQAIEYRDYSDSAFLLRRTFDSFRRYVLFFLLTYYGVVILHQAV